jgi:hypothetical protein
MARVLVDQFITSYARPPQLIVLDFDRIFPPDFGEMRAISEGYLNSYFIS